MKFTAAHNNYNVMDLDKSIAFYEKALGLQQVRTHEAPDGSFRLVFMEGPDSPHQLELTWVADRKEQYNLGDNEFHLAFTADEIDTAHQLHAEMGCIIYENHELGVYFIVDPDGYWIEIIPKR